MPDTPPRSIRWIILAYLALSLIVSGFFWISACRKHEEKKVASALADQTHVPEASLPSPPKHVEPATGRSLPPGLIPTTHKPTGKSTRVWTTMPFIPRTKYRTPSAALRFCSPRASTSSFMPMVRALKDCTLLKWSSAKHRSANS